MSCLRTLDAGDDVGVEGEYRLRRHVRVLHFALVRVVAVAAVGTRVLGSPDACAWLTEVYGPDAGTKVPPEFEAAAESGAVLALAQVGQPLAVTVTMIVFMQADTTPDDVKFATAHAVWQAVGHAPASPPYIDADGVHFPPALTFAAGTQMARTWVAVGAAGVTGGAVVCPGGVRRKAEEGLARSHGGGEAGELAVGDVDGVALAGTGGVRVVENVGEGVAVGVDQGAGLAVERAQVLAPQV
jgi:hypothetical protein